MTELRYRPKGGMCANCRHVLTRDCSDLPFYRMPVIESDGKAATVKCTEYSKTAIAKQEPQDGR